MEILSRMWGNDTTGEGTDDIFIIGQETEMEDPRFDYRKCSICGDKMGENQRRKGFDLGKFLVKHGLICESCGKIYCPDCADIMQHKRDNAICYCGTKLALHVIGD